MRENLFRGKRKDNGEWVEGVYYKQTLYYGDPCEEHYIITSTESLCYDQALEYYEVIPETVGQYTDLTDKNGKKIFEGDILKIARVSDSAGNHYYPPLPFPVNVVVEWDMCAWMWAAICEKKMYISFPEAWCHFECEVIGNIHDNPELLERKGGE